jgi:hypothetical protein
MTASTILHPALKIFLDYFFQWQNMSSRDGMMAEVSQLITWLLLSIGHLGNVWYVTHFLFASS